MASINVSILFFLFLLSLNVSISAGDNEEKEFVLSLDHSNFTDIVTKHDFMVVEFYAPWCGHCKKLAPEYEKAASILGSHDPPIVLAKVDANDDANQDLADQYNIQGFPTLKILRSGGKFVQEYKGPRDAEGIVEYLKKQSGPASVEIKSAEDATNLIGDDKIVVVGVFSKFSGEEFENFMSLAEELRSDYEFGHALDAEHLPRGDSSAAGPLIRLFKPFDELVLDFKDFDLEAMENFVEHSSLPVVTIYNNDPKHNPFVIKFFNSPDAKAMLFVNFSSDIVDSFMRQYYEVAKQYKGEGVKFLLGDVEASEGAFQFFGLKQDQVPLIIIQTPDRQKYLKTNLEPDHVATWVRDFMEGEVPIYKKSEPIPEVNNDPVKVVVANSLDDMVFNSGKNVLLEFYAPWCGHCKKLAPILDEVASYYEKDPEVLITKLDATANDIPRNIFDVKGYPTIYFRSRSGHLVLYEGDQTKEDIIKFIQNNKEKTAAQAESVKDEL